MRNNNLRALYRRKKISDVRMNGYRSNLNDRDIPGRILHFF